MLKISSMASDGASVMTDKTLLPEHSAALINIHCVCHRLALACTTPIAGIKQVTSVELNLRQLWKLFDNSPKLVAVYSKVLAEQKYVKLM